MKPLGLGQPAANQVDLGLRSRDAALGLLLEGMEHVDRLVKLRREHGPEPVAGVISPELHGDGSLQHGTDALAHEPGGLRLPMPDGREDFQHVDAGHLGNRAPANARERVAFQTRQPVLGMLRVGPRRPLLFEHPRGTQMVANIQVVVTVADTALRNAGTGACDSRPRSKSVTTRYRASPATCSMPSRTPRTALSDEVHVIRDQVRADMVTLVTTPDPQLCGRG